MLMPSARVGLGHEASLVLCAEIERDSSSQSDAVRQTRLQTFDSDGADSFAL
jgi:hypothetical protein